MKRGNLVIYIIIPVVLILGFLLYQYLFKVYEAVAEVEPAELFADNQSTVEIIVIPLNSFGWKVPFRSSPSEFEIIEGKSLVEIKLMNREEGKMILSAKSETGKVVVRIKSRYSLLPMIVEIPIHPNLT
jgi:hypothetical protein